jgi:PAS domain S-box-containing protein
MVVGAGVMGIADGSRWRTLLTPTIAYRPAILFGLTLVFGWRGFLWAQVVFLAAFADFLGWRSAVFITPMFLLSQGCALWVARKLARNKPWLARERPTLAFLAGAVLATAIPALFYGEVQDILGIARSGVASALDSWLRGTAAILSIVPAVLVYCSAPLKKWAGMPPLRDGQEPIAALNLLELGIEASVWIATLWISVEFKARYGLNITYLTFLPPLAFTLFRGMRLATLALAMNAFIATTLWRQLHWADLFPAADLRLLLAIYAMTILVLAAVVDEHQRGRALVAKLRAAEAELGRSEERLRLAIKATNDAIWDIDLKAGTIGWNETYTNAYGRPERADSWQFWVDRIHPEDRANTTEGFQAALNCGASSWSARYRFRRVTGEWAHIYDRAYIARDETGKAWRVIGAMQDLTEHKQSEAALRESEERFRRVFEEGPLGLALVGKDYRFLNANAALCQMLGYQEDELIQKTFADITHPDDVRADIEFAERLFRREIPFYRIQKRYLKKTGEILWINLTASIIADANGEPIHGMAMIEDVTEIKRTQDEMLFRQKLESLGTLAGGIAHDFNNLLGAIEAQAELAATELDAGSSCKEELKTIREGAMRGSEIVRQLLIYAGKEDAVAGLVDLSSTAAEMLSLMKVSVTKHAVIRTDLAANLPAIRANAAQLRQIVMNLVTNASDAIGDRDGVIRLTTRRVAAAEESDANLSGTPANQDCVQLEVSDTGCGMSSETQAKIFDPFFTTKSPGRGLGLAVVQGIVRSLGGSIRLTSEPGQGTTFRISLPCVETAAEASSEMNPGNEKLPAASQCGAILVVEDEGDLRRPMVKMLRKSGFEIFEAGDGSSAIELLHAHRDKIDVILLDMTIPGASSHEVVAEAAIVRPDIRVILTSAYSREMIESTKGLPQVRAFIRKPFQLGELLKTLRSLGWSDDAAARQADTNP